MDVYKISFKECIEPCKVILGEVKVDKVNNRIRRKIVRDARVSAKSIQVIQVGSFMSMKIGKLCNDCQMYWHIRFRFFMLRYELP